MNEVKTQALDPDSVPGYVRIQISVEALRTVESHLADIIDCVVGEPINEGERGKAEEKKPLHHVLVNTDSEINKIVTNLHDKLSELKSLILT